MDIIQFQNKLKEIQTLALNNGKKVSEELVRRFFQEDGLEEEKLKKELARVNGMLNNEKFMSKAPQAKVDEEKAKLAKYAQMMEQVQERLGQLRK